MLNRKTPPVDLTRSSLMTALMLSNVCCGPPTESVPSAEESLPAENLGFPPAAAMLAPKSSPAVSRKKSASKG